MSGQAISTLSARESAHRGRSGRALATTGAVLLLVTVVLAALAPAVAPFDPAAQGVGPRLSGPSGDHWLGTDRFGRDVWSRILHGGRTTLLATGLVMAAVVVIGSVVGAAVSSLGARGDVLARRVIDLLVAFPVVVVALAFVGLRGPSFVTVLTGVLIVLWAPFARLARSLVRSALAEPSALTARALGSGRTRLLRREVWPRMRGPMLVLATVETAQLISVVAGLSFLGVGAQPPSPEWGAMLQDGRSALFTAPHLVLAPGAAVLVVIVALVCVSEGLRDLLDPQGRTADL